MGLTPLDIRNKEFRKSFRGYSEAEVDAFLDQVVREFDALTRDHAALREQLEHMAAKVEQYQRLEDTLHNTLVVAQQAAEEVRASARKEADVILEQARIEAERLLHDAETQAERVRKHAEELIRRARVYQAQIKGMLASQLDLLESEGRKLEQASREVAAALVDDGPSESAGDGAPPAPVEAPIPPADAGAATVAGGNGSAGAAG